jgi:NADPH2:quinone reductase
LIRVHAAGINPADTYIRAGAYYRLPSLPYIPGFDASGVIERIGADVTNFKVQTKGTINLKKITDSVTFFLDW